MSQRERTLTIVLLIGIFTAVGGFFGYQFILEPLRAQSKQIATLSEEIDTRDKRVLEIETDKVNRYDPAKKLSLPADLTLARREYEMQLSGLLRRSDFQAGSIIISSRAPDSKNSPTIFAKKPAYTKLTFVVQVKGELASLVDFLDHFYRQPLLHQIRAMNVTRLSRAGERTRANELDINLTIEALVLENAENRQTLAHVPVPLTLVGGNAAGFGIGKLAVDSGKGSPYDLQRARAPEDKQPMRLAVPPREYASIAGKNVFFGPPPPPRKEAPPTDDRPREPDLAPYLRLTALSVSDDGTGRAHVFDFYNQYDYQVEQRLKNEVVVEGKYYIKDRRRTLIRSDDAEECDLEFGDKEGGNYVRLRVLKVADGDLIVQAYEKDKEKPVRFAGGAVFGGVARMLSPGKIYKWHVGELMKDMVLVTPREVKSDMQGAGILLVTPPAARTGRGL